MKFTQSFVLQLLRYFPQEYKFSVFVGFNIYRNNRIYTLSIKFGKQWAIQLHE